MRLFIAIPIPEELKRYASSLRQEMEKAGADIKWVEPENYHLTLKFLGDVPEETVNDIIEFLERAAVSSTSFDIRLQGLGFFPNRRRPRVIWIGVEGEIDKAMFLGERVDSYLSAFGFEAEEKRSYHLTLGRIRSEKNITQLLNKAAILDESVGSKLFTVNEFCLMESQLTGKGPLYTLKKKFYLD